MSEERKPHVWPWIAALLIGLPVLYVASFGPACWISSRCTILVRPVEIGYRPVLLAWYFSPPSVGDVLEWYAKIGARDGWYWTTDNQWYHYP